MIKLRLTNLRLRLEEDEEKLTPLAGRRLGVAARQILSLTIVKKALDARKADRLEFVYTVDVEVEKCRKGIINPPFIETAPGPFSETLERGSAHLALPPVVIGSDVLFGPSVQIYAATHPLSYQERRTGLELGKPVRIGSDVWIGGAVVINPGVTIGSQSVIGSGSVVTQDIPAGVFAAGNPCRVIRELQE
jgi:hypothetical protein